MVKDFPLDGMHVVYLGAVRKLLRSWVIGKYKRGVKLSSLLQAIFSRFLEFLAQFITVDFSRKSRSLTELCYFKATEFRLFCLYLGPIVLREILSEELYSHFLLLHVAIKLLSDKVHCKVHEVVEYCKDLLYFFVRDSTVLYGKRFISFNVHSLIHIPDDVKKYGSLDSYSALRFENHLGKMKHLVRKSAKPLAQIVNRLTEIHESVKISAKEDESSVRVSQQHWYGPQLHGNGGKQFKKLQYGPWRFSNSCPDNCLFIKNEGPILVENLIANDNGEVAIIGRLYTKTDDLFQHPLPSRRIGTYLVSNHDLSELSSWPLTSIVCKGMRLPLNCPATSAFVICRILKQDVDNCV